jgi:hypothetical protein
MRETYEETLNGEPEGILVHWMDRPRHHLSTSALVSVVTGAFLLGAGVGLALAGQLRPESALRSRAAQWLH